MSEYGITEEDMKECIDYDLCLEEYNKILLLRSQRISYCIGFSMFFLMMLYCVKINILPNAICLQKDDIGGICTILIIVGIPFSFAITSLFSKLIPISLIQYFVKKMLMLPHRPIHLCQTKLYKDALNSFYAKNKRIDITYPGIKDTRYDIVLYANQQYESFVANLITFTEKKNREILKDNAKHFQKFWFELDPFDFEKEVAEWFRRKGFKARTTKKSGDEGIDIVVKKDNYTAYVQCKRYTTSKVDRPTLNALYGVVCADNVNQGIIVCLNGVTKEAALFAERTNIRVYTINDLAPEDDLFHRFIPNDLLSLQLTTLNEDWYKIGAICFCSTCFQKKEDAANWISRLPNHNKVYIHTINGLYFILYCDEELHPELDSHFNPKPTKYNNSFYKYKRVRRRKYYY